LPILAGIKIKEGACLRKQMEDDMVNPVYGVGNASPYLQPADDFQQILTNAATHTDPGGIGDDGGTVKRNSAGKVVEVDYPNGTHRTFGYDNSGNLDRVVQPDGTVDQLVNGKWDDGTRAGPDLLNPDVSQFDGTFSYQTGEGAYVNDYNNGTQTTINKDLSFVTQDADGNVTEVDYPDGSQRQFIYVSGKLTQIVDNGKTYTVDSNGNIIGPDGQSIGKNPSVASDGTYRYTNPNDYPVSIMRNGRTVITNGPGGPVIEIDYPGGTSRQFHYSYSSTDPNGKLDAIKDTDGKWYITNGNGVWYEAATTWSQTELKVARFSNPRVSADGTYSYTDANGKVVSD
jgi:hypothetical protein